MEVLQVVVATHAILQKNVRFFDLGLIIIDEEQRLGVIQKNTLLMHAPRADVLTMTATPIPRTLYLSLVGLKDLSYLNSPPPSRKSSNISIEIFNWDRIKFCMEQELKRNGQVLVVAPHIKLAVDFLQQFKNITNFIPSVIIDFAHGQMNNCSEVIQRFREKKVV
jgi:transcription-repair coupling factor (superfamily II helicase)